MANFPLFSFILIMITAISSNINNFYSKKQVSFGTIERAVTDDKLKRPDDLSNVKWRNNTYLFRRDLPWNMVTNHIIRGHKPRKIYCYACSDGSEPYSIAISLISKLGYEDAQKYFPIIARDRDPYVINSAKQGFIRLVDEDFIPLMSKNTGNIRCFSPIRHNCFEVNDKLRKCVDFEVGDILKDKDYLNYDGSVIFFRNVWPYLKKDEQIVLVETFAERFQKDTSLIVGDFDMNNNPCDSFFKMFPNEIQDLGLWQTKPKIFQANHIEKEPSLFIKNLRISVHNMTTELYCKLVNHFCRNHND